jgi:DNA-binding beta-propeller fold protein YncE
VTVDREGNIYVNDAFNFRIQKFDPGGNFLKAFGYPGDTLGGFARPKGLGVDREGRVYVVDAAFENVQIFEDETTDLLLWIWTGAGENVSAEWNTYRLQQYGIFRKICG